MVREKNGSWIVNMTCVVKKEVVCEKCTEEQAKNDPWLFCVEEREVEQHDWVVDSVEPNE